MLVSLPDASASFGNPALRNAPDRERMGGHGARRRAARRRTGSERKEMSDDSAPKVIPPEQKALDAALRITNVNDRLAALEKIRLGYPKSPLLNDVDAQILAGVLQMPDAEDSASEVLDRMVARIPAGSSPDARS